MEGEAARPSMLPARWGGSAGVSERSFWPGSACPGRCQHDVHNQRQQQLASAQADAAAAGGAAGRHLHTAWPIGA